MKSIREIIRYSAVGVANTICDFTIFSVLYYVFGVQLLIANTVAFFFAVTQSYFLNKIWTFREYAGSDFRTVRNGKQFLLFLVINLGCLTISNGTVYLLVDYVPALLAKIAAVFLVLVWGFFLSRRYVFQLTENHSG